jgi:hypothetical protein
VSGCIILSDPEKAILIDAHLLGAVSLPAKSKPLAWLLSFGLLRPTKLGKDRYEITDAGRAWLETAR